MNKVRNYKWYELIKELKGLIEKSDGVEVKEGVVSRYNNLRGGTEYLLTDKFYKWNTSCGDINLNVFDTDDGTFYELNCRRSDFGSEKGKCGRLIVDVTEDKITFGRDWDFLKVNNKPATIEYIRTFVQEAIKQLIVLNRLAELVEESADKIDLIHAYLHNKEITGNETEEEINDIVEKSLKIKKLDKNDLLEEILRKHFNCDKKDHMDVLKYRISNSDYFIWRCIDKGILGDDYFGYKDNYYKYC